MRRLIPLAALGLVTGCQPPGDTKVDGAWIRLAAAPGRPAAGYFTIRGGATDRMLTGVTSPGAGRIELHETMKMDGKTAGDMGAMTMKPVGQIPIPAGGTVTFAPGGKHLMMFDMARAIGPGTKVPLVFQFADGRDAGVNATAVAAGDPAPQP